MNILKLAAISHNGRGGNPTGVMLCEKMPAEEMLEIAKHLIISIRT